MSEGERGFEQGAAEGESERMSEGERGFEQGAAEGESERMSEGERGIARSAAEAKARLGRGAVCDRRLSSIQQAKAAG